MGNLNIKYVKQKLDYRKKYDPLKFSNGKI